MSLHQGRKNASNDLGRMKSEMGSDSQDAPSLLCSGWRQDLCQWRDQGHCRSGLKGYSLEIASKQYIAVSVTCTPVLVLLLDMLSTSSWGASGHTS